MRLKIVPQNNPARQRIIFDMAGGGPTVHGMPASADYAYVKGNRNGNGASITSTTDKHANRKLTTKALQFAQQALQHPCSLCHRDGGSIVAFSSQVGKFAKLKMAKL